MQSLAELPGSRQVRRTPSRLRQGAEQDEATATGLVGGRWQSEKLKIFLLHSPPWLQSSPVPAHSLQPGELPWSLGVWLLPHSLPPQQELASFQYPMAVQKLTGFGRGKTRDPLVLFFTSELPNLPAERNWHSLSKPGRFLNGRSP